jgi:hypothetical protein
MTPEQAMSVVMSVPLCTDAEIQALIDGGYVTPETGEQYRSECAGWRQHGRRFHSVREFEQWFREQIACNEGA